MVEQNISGLELACDHALRNIESRDARFRLADMLHHDALPFATPASLGPEVEKLCLRGQAMAERLRIQIWAAESAADAADIRVRLVATGTAEMKHHLLALTGAVTTARK